MGMAEALDRVFGIMGVSAQPAEKSESGNWLERALERGKAWEETVIADIETPDGVIAIDARRRHCGNCEHCMGIANTCLAFHVELEAETREEDGQFLDWKRCGECLSAQIAAS